MNNLNISISLSISFLFDMLLAPLISLLFSKRNDLRLKILNISLYSSFFVSLIYFINFSLELSLKIYLVIFFNFLRNIIGLSALFNYNLIVSEIKSFEVKEQIKHFQDIFSPIFKILFTFLIFVFFTFLESISIKISILVILVFSLHVLSYLTMNDKKLK